MREIDKKDLINKCQVGVLPLGTGNDLARVLGWGSAFDDEAQLAAFLEKLDHAQIKMLDRWSILTYEGLMPDPRKDSLTDDAITLYEDSVAAHLTKIVQSDNHKTVIGSAKVLCATVKDFVERIAEIEEEEDESSSKCAALQEKLDSLLNTLEAESREVKREKEDLMEKEEEVKRKKLMSRANSLKKAVRELIEHAEKRKFFCLFFYISFKNNNYAKKNLKKY